MAANERSGLTVLPEGWQMVRFDEMAQLVNDRVDNPSEAGVERYVGLEHLDPESLKLRRWGAPDDVEAQKLRFKPGDIIFGKRRAYQRKLAVADFEGICSAHAMVLRARESIVVKEFLPVFMQSDIFFERALSISVGSLSPTINWRTLAEQRFLLPPQGEQSRLADLLWAVNDCLEKEVDLEASLVQLLDSFTEDFLSHGIKGMHDRFIETDIGVLPNTWQTLSGEELYKSGPRNGLSPETNANGVGYPTLSIGAVRDGRVIADGNIKYAVVSPEEAEKFSLKAGDVLVVRGNGNRELVGRCGIVSEVPTGCFYPDLLIRIGFDETKIRTPFACVQWNSPVAHKRLLTKAKSTNGIWKVNGKDLRQHKLAVPPLEEQDAFLRLLEPQLATLAEVRNKVNASRNLRRGLSKHLLRADEPNV